MNTENILQKKNLTADIARLKNKKVDLSDVYCQGMCEKRCSCDQCRTARMSNTDYQTALNNNWSIDRQIESLKKARDFITASPEYLEWKYGGDRLLNVISNEVT